MYLTIKTDNPVAEIGVYKGSEKLSYYTWEADRSLARDLLKVMHGQLTAQRADWPQVAGIVVYKGPGSFTGLRIGITVANTLAYGRGVAVVGTTGDAWITDGLARLQQGDNDRIVMPHYGAEAHITLPKK